MKKLLLAFALVLAPQVAFAQCNGVFPPNTLCGNLSGVPAPPSAFSSGGTIVGPGSSIVNNFALWNNTSGTQLKDAGFTTGTTGHSIPFLDGTNIWTNPQTFVGITATSGSFTSLVLNGSGGGNISILPQTAAGTYNFNLPTSAGTAGQFLTSGGGGGAPMTWTTPPATLSQLFVNHATGSDSNTCLTALVPCATIQHAYAIFQSNYCNGGSVTITIAAETFTEQVALRGAPCMNGGYQTFITCSGCQWNIANNQTALSVRDYTAAVVSGITFFSTGTVGTTFLAPTQFGVIDIAANVTFGGNTAGNDIGVASGGSLNCDNPYTVVGSGRGNHIFIQGASNVACNTSATVGAMVVTGAWVTIQGTGTAVMSGWSCSGGAGCGAGTTGTKYNVSGCGDLIIGSAVLPGTVAGTPVSGASLTTANCAGIQ